MDRQLDKWGLTKEDAEKLGWEEVVINEPGLPRVRAIRIPYFEPTNSRQQVIAINGNPFTRYRVLAHELAGEDAEQKMRYCQPKGTGVEAYFPPSVPWDEISNDPGVDVVITEGEAKAAKACREGFATIGLGGVNSFRSLRQGIFLCRTLEQFNWRGRNVYIAFDSDIVTNENVVNALNILAETLKDYYAITYCTFIPPVDDEKVGVDDYLNTNGAVEFSKLLDQSPPVGAIAALIDLNRRYYVIRNTASIYSLELKKLVSRSNFSTVLESTKKSVKFKVQPGGVVRTELVSAADEWLKWPMRAELKKVVYEPGQPEVIDGNLNIWGGWGLKPRKGDPSPFTQLLDYMFGMDIESKRWFTQWLAYPLQHPGTKMFVCSVLYSTEHGTGKSFLGQIIGKIYGENFAEISPNDLGKSFNEWAENKQFVLGDEITSGDKRKENDSLKKLITQGEIRINKKYLEEFVIRDCINYLFTTNHPDAFFLEDKDRRFFIHEIENAPLHNDFYDKLHDWIYNENGAEVVFNYLLNYDCKGFSPRARAPETLGKKMMFEAGLGDLASWVRNLRNHPDEILARSGTAAGKDIFTAKELLQLYDPNLQTKCTSNGMTRELARAGIRSLLRGERVATPTGFDRVYAVRNYENWSQAHYKLVQENVSIKIAGQQRF